MIEISIWYGRLGNNLIQLRNALLRACPQALGTSRSISSGAAAPNRLARCSRLGRADHRSATRPEWQDVKFLEHLPLFSSLKAKNTADAGPLHQQDLI